MGGTNSKAKAKRVKKAGSPSVSSVDGEEFYREPDAWSDDEDEETVTQLLKKVVSSALIKQDISEDDKKSGFAFKISLLLGFTLTNIVYLMFIMYGPNHLVAWMFFAYIFICAIPKIVFGTLFPLCGFRRCIHSKQQIRCLDADNLDSRIWNICSQEVTCSLCGELFDDFDICPRCGANPRRELPPLVSACVTVHHEYGAGLLAGVESFETSELPFSKTRLQLVYVVDGRHDGKGVVDTVQCETVKTLLAKLYGIPESAAVIDSDGLVKFYLSNGVQLISILPEINSTDRTAIYRGFLSSGVNTGMPFIVLLKDRNGGKRDSHRLFFEYMDRGILSKTLRFIMFVDSDMQFSDIHHTCSLKTLYEYIKPKKLMGGGCGEIEVWDWQNNLITMMQYFEYKSNQFLAKLFESFFGMVTCLPGAFCMIRPQAMEDVLNEYLKTSTDVVEKNQLDLGEDRTLTTLLLTAGWETGYAPDAIALTDVPKNLCKLVRQRRRWTNSTLVNMFFLLKHTYTKVYAFPLILNMAIELFSVFVLPCAILSLFFQVWVEAGIPIGFCCAFLFVYLFCVFMCSLLTGLGENAYVFGVFAIVFGLMIFLMIIYIVLDLGSFLSQYWVETAVTVSWIIIICGAAVLNKRGMSVFSIIAPLSWLFLSPTLYVTFPIYAMCNFDDVSWGTR